MPNHLEIFLASSSPRRQQLLSLADIKFSTMRVDIDESINAFESPQDYIQRMVDSKALAATKQLFADNMIVNERSISDHSINTSLSIEEEVKTENSHKGVLLDTENSPIFKLVITADTIGVLPDGNSILVKPVDKADAFDMWAKMSGQIHTVWTAVQLNLIDARGIVINKETVLEKTEVTFIELTTQDMEAYWKMGESYDKAGGYAIQGKGAIWVERINGSYTNVVGLPLAQTLAAIKKLQQQSNMP